MKKTSQTVGNLFIISFLIFILLSSFRAETEQEKTRILEVLAKEELIKDFEVFKSIYEKANSGLYKYRSKSEVDSVFAIAKAQLTTEMTYREFYNLLWEVIDYTGSCHNSLRYPEFLDSHLNSQDIFFPIPLKHIEQKLYTNGSFEEIPLGSEIISVNEIPSNEFLELISKYISTDGYNTSGKYANIETDWLPFYIYLAIGESDEFVVEYRDLASQTIEKRQVASVNYDGYYDNYDERHSRDFEQRISDDYTFELLDSINTGLLTVQSFALGGPTTDDHKQYASFLDSVFADLKEQNVKNLIVDIRGNGGGDDPNDLLLYSYLTNRKFKENTSAYTLFQEVPFKEYYADDDSEELALELIEEHSILKNGKYFQHESFNPFWSPNENTFTGRIYLLIDPYVASAGSLFASLIKSDQSPLVIGEETLGGYYGHTGHIPVTYELPHSKFELTFFIVDLEQDVQKLKDETYGAGIVPDLKVVQTHKDFLDNKDTQLNFAIERIKM